MGGGGPDCWLDTSVGNGGAHRSLERPRWVDWWHCHYGCIVIGCHIYHGGFATQTGDRFSRSVVLGVIGCGAVVLSLMRIVVFLVQVLPMTRGRFATGGPGWF